VHFSLTSPKTIFQKKSKLGELLEASIFQFCLISKGKNDGQKMNKNVKKIGSNKGKICEVMGM
jgi:hypothetical protein